MENPWLNLDSKNDDYLLEMDRGAILSYNRRVNPTCRVILESVPEPFIGNPQSARAVLLLLNPGHDESDLQSHRREDFKLSMFRNLRHEQQRFPFYPLNPEFKATGSAKWWRKRIGSVIEETTLDEEVLAERLLAIEFFPYHSRSSALPLRALCRSQEYTFEIARKMLRSRLVIAMRSVRYWAHVDLQFSKIPHLKNPRSCYVSRGNMDAGLFEDLVKTLRD